MGRTRGSAPAGTAPAGAPRAPGLPAFVARLKDKLGFVTVADIEPEQPVRTLFTSYNRATGIGGHPRRRLVLMHGKNQSGKSALALGIAESFRRVGHIPVLFETEHGAEKRWYNELAMGEGILLERPGTMDDLVRQTQGLFDMMVAARSQKKNPLNAQVCYCFIVDTITKLIPMDMLAKILKDGIGKQFPGQANAVSLWMKILIPQLYKLGSTMILVTQERENLDPGGYGPKMKIAGGQAIQFDTSLRVHMTGAEKVYERVACGDDDDDDDDKKAGKLMVGLGHSFRIEKNKSAGISEECGTFYTSNGRGSMPLGFDLVREVVDEADYRDCIHTREKVTVLKVGDARVLAKGGKAGLIAKLQAEPELRQQVADELDNGCAG